MKTIYLYIHKTQFYQMSEGLTLVVIGSHWFLSADKSELKTSLWWHCCNPCCDLG